MGNDQMSSINVTQTLPLLSLSSNPFQADPRSAPVPQHQSLHLQTKNTNSSSSVSSPELASAAEWIESLRSKTRSNRFQEAIFTYQEMMLAGFKPDNFAFPAVLKAVGGLHDLKLGKQIHAQALKFGYGESSVSVANTLVNMYGKCGDIGDAHQVFDKITERDQVSWNSMIAAMCRYEEWGITIELFRAMISENVEPSSFTLVSLAIACSNLSKNEGLKLGKQVHGHSLRKGDCKSFTNNALMAMYAKLGRMDYCRELFESFEDRDLVSWNTVISSFSQNQQFCEALMFLNSMIDHGTEPDAVTIASVLPACSHLQMFGVGRELHAFALKHEDMIKNSFVGSALVDMYCSCHHVKKAFFIFDSLRDRRIGLWNAMIAGYAQNDHDYEALKLFIEMEETAGLSSNATTMASVLPACVRCEAFSAKEGIHALVIKKGLENNRYVQNAMVDMYARRGDLETAEAIFNSIGDRDVVSWNTMITGYVLSECHDKALSLLNEMQVVEEEEEDYEDEKGTRCRPNSVTLMTVLPGCAALSALVKGKEIHSYAIKNMLETDFAVGSALVDMYAKCGCLNLSRRVFDQMPVRNVITWNVIIMAYGMHGRGEEAMELFSEMVKEGKEEKGVKPNEVTFIAIFAACSHSGMVEQGLNLFHRMKQDHGVEPRTEHYGCIVDLLGRSGRVVEAYEMVKSMPFDLDKTDAWSSLLGASRIHKNLEIGEIAAMNLIQAEPDVASHYVLLSNIYSSAGIWDKATEVRRKMKEMGVKKEPGCSWIEFEDEVHKFIARDSSHPQSREIHHFLETLSVRMRKEGYIPDTSCVLHNVDEDEKEALLCGHSEKLAIAFGILNTSPGSVIRVAKNLRVCNDCHVACKFISRIEEREIVLRDVRRFHHFKDGKCSCGDYW